MKSREEKFSICDQESLIKYENSVKAGKNRTEYADTEPRCLHIEKRQVIVTEIIDRWLDPTHRYFILRGNDGGIYLVRHDNATDNWDMTLYDKGTRDDTRWSLEAHGNALSPE